MLITVTPIMKRKLLVAQPINAIPTAPRNWPTYRVRRSPSQATRGRTIPPEIKTVKGYATQEKEIFTRIADSRAKLAGAKTPEETITAANEQSSALARLLVVVENYPTLKSDANFQRLMDELSSTENRIAVARGRYNERIQEYNTSRRRFPANVTAKMFGFKEYPYFEAPKDAQQAPKVNFGAR